MSPMVLDNVQNPKEIRKTGQKWHFPKIVGTQVMRGDSRLGCPEDELLGCPEDELLGILKGNFPGFPKSRPFERAERLQLL